MTTRPRSLASLGALVLLLASMLVPAATLAHAELDVATPANGATVEGSPPEISGTFTQDVEPDESSLQLRDAEGTVIAEGGPVADDPRGMAIAEFPDLAPGEYEVRWTTLSAEDGELVRGTWSFTVTAAPTPSPSPTPSPTVAPSATIAPTPSPPEAPSPTVAPSPSADGGDSTGDPNDVILPILIALVLVAIVGGFLLTRRGRTTPPA
jgi:methionine-rich copper-binding protein CopC